MPIAHIIKIEDARTGQWLRHLDPVTDPIRRIDMGWTMGDWNQLDVTTETVGLRESTFSIEYDTEHVLVLVPVLALGLVHNLSSDRCQLPAASCPLMLSLIVH